MTIAAMPEYEKNYVQDHMTATKNFQNESAEAYSGHVKRSRWRFVQKNQTVNYFCKGL